MANTCRDEEGKPLIKQFAPGPEPPPQSPRVQTPNIFDTVETRRAAVVERSNRVSLAIGPNPVRRFKRAFRIPN